MALSSNWVIASKLAATTLWWCFLAQRRLRANFTHHTRLSIRHDACSSIRNNTSSIFSIFTSSNSTVLLAPWYTTCWVSLVSLIIEGWLVSLRSSSKCQHNGIISNLSSPISLRVFILLHGFISFSSMHLVCIDGWCSRSAFEKGIALLNNGLCTSQLVLLSHIFKIIVNQI